MRTSKSFLPGLSVPLGGLEAAALEYLGAYSQYDMLRTQLPSIPNLQNTSLSNTCLPVSLSEQQTTKPTDPLSFSEYRRNLLRGNIKPKRNSHPHLPVQPRSHMKGPFPHLRLIYARLTWPAACPRQATVSER